MLEKGENISEGQAGFRPSRSCVEYVYRLGKIVQGRKDGRANDVLFPLRCNEGLRHSMYGGIGRGKMCGELGSEERRNVCAKNAAMLDGDVSR